MKQTKKLALVLAFSLALPFQAPLADTLTIGVTQYPSTLNPLIESMLAKTYVLGATQRRLMDYDQSWQPVCRLCTQIPSFENGLAEEEALPAEAETDSAGPGVALTFTLQPNATWGDGTPVTTQDVVFTWEVGRHPQSGVANVEAFRRILSIEVIDDKTFVLHADRVTWDYNVVSLDLLPAHIERAIFEEDPASYRFKTAYVTDPTNPGLAFGPYRIADTQTGVSITLVRNDTWWGTPPAFDEVVIRTIENTAALEANLLSGEIDMISGDLGLTLDQAIAFEARHGEDYQILYVPGLIYEHIDVMQDNPLLADPRVRQALMYASDRAAISERLFEGRQPVANGPVSELDPMYSDQTPTYAYDPARAIQLLEEAGFTEMDGDIRTKPDGTRLSLEIMTTAGNRTRELIEQVLQSQWRQVGVDLTIRNETARVFFGETVTKRLYPSLALYAWLSAPQSVPRTTLHSSQIPSADNAWSGQNSVGYANPRMDDLIDAMEIERDEDLRRALFAQMQNLYATDLPALPLFWRANAYIMPKWLTGVRPTGHLVTTTNWIEEWRRAP